MKKNVLITGASGYLGKNLVNHLLKNTSWQIIAQCRQEDSCRQFSDNKRITKVTANLLEPGSFSIILNTYAPEIIIHLAAIARFNDGQAKPEEALLTNFSGTVHLIEMAEKAGTKKFIFTSSDLARNARSVVGIGKLLVEYFILLHESQTVASMAIRLPNIFNSPSTVFDIFKRQINNNEDLTITDPGMARRFITIQEGCNFITLLMKQGKNQSVYAIDQQPLYINDLAKQMIHESGKPLSIKIIGAKPGEKLYEDSYADIEIAEHLGSKLIRLKPSIPTPDEIKQTINQLPLSDKLKQKIIRVFQTQNK